MATKLGQVAWLPAPGRYEVCRRESCREPAVVETLALCEAHMLAYKAEVAHVLGEAEAKRRPRARGK
jgi:hypothetical protein